MTTQTETTNTELLAACKLAEDLICGRLDGEDPENTIVLPALKAAIESAAHIEA